MWLIIWRVLIEYHVLGQINQPMVLVLIWILVLVYGYVIKPLLNQVKMNIRNEIEKLTALNIKYIKLTAKLLL